MKAAIYCRLSDEDREKASRSDESGSIRNQKALLSRYAAEQGWEVYDVYSDDDYAGADRNRPAFRRLLSDAQNRLFDVVLCTTQSRFTRELELVEKYIHYLFPLWGVRFVSVVDHADTDLPGNKKSRQINGLVNEWYLEDLSESIRSVLTDRRKRGFHIGAFALYGYRKDPVRKGHLLIDPEAARVVQEVFTRFARGDGKSAIARALNDRGVPNPTEYKRLHGLRYQQPARRNSGLWKYSAISAMLRNEMYAGTMVQGKYGSVSYKSRRNRPRPKELWYRVEGTHEAIIPPELWTRVQDLLQQRAKPFQSGAVGPFARKVRCLSCGYTLRASGSRGRRYLQCPSRRVSGNACAGAFIAVETLERIVTTELKRISSEYLNPDALLDALPSGDSPDEQRKRLLSDLASWRRKIRDADAALQALYLDKVKGILSETEFLFYKQSFSDDKARLEALSDGAREQLQQLEQPSAAPAPREQIETYLRPPRLTRELSDTFIDYITVGKRAPGEKLPPVEIHWKF